ncbi:Zn(II)2Cys6 transcription factor [Cordyceps javanica]|uniref:Zn(II)2Cys6 transcription factor n=1 Tax=Cordyceps javanica TaxID=43265 RepID=A0A545W2G5_9HYPO|nr:Zn(II)2Cys6 transcription factor [Cordyceps javanica]TQW08075.1 Zn(II)2Cys6 transcription factor [Cordyceps javanica]
MGRPRKRRPVDDEPSGAQAPASRRRPSPGIQRSRSASSSTPSTGPEVQSFQLSGTPAPSFGDANLSFLDHQASTPDLAFFDLLPSYYQDGIALTPASQAECASTHAFHGTLPIPHETISAYNDMSFLDPAFASATHTDGPDTFGATPELSAGSHTPFNSEPSFSPPPQHPRASAQPLSDSYAPAGGSEALQPIPTVSCPCLSSLYMALESLTNLPSDISAAMRVARHASKVAQGVITCKVCSCDLLDISKPPPMQAFQNMMLLATLVPSACNAYTAIIEMIDRKRNLAMQQGCRIHFSLRETGALWDQQAVGGGWLPAKFMELDNTELDPHEWRQVMLAIIRLDVYGNKERRLNHSRGPSGMLGLSEVVAALDERSQKRHELVDASSAAGTLPPHRHYMMTPRSCKPEDRNCVRVLEVARLALNSLVIA